MEFPRIESHYCRKKSKRQYLHPDLTVKKMHSMFVNEYNVKISYPIYLNVFNGLRLSFYHPKKDQCGLCFTYREGNDDKKRELEDTYQQHIAEKECVRTKKQQEKNDPDILKTCAVFDLQQVIFLPISNDSKLFYKRRLSNYNFTIYDIKSKECHCFLWHEGLSKRGSCEISTCLYKYLNFLDEKGIKNVSLFSDGCTGQNKNSIVTSMLLHVVSTSKNIETISLNFFESEGDSAHSAIEHAIKKCVKLFVPSQLSPVVRLARRDNPYIVHSLTSEDFLNFKQFSEDLKIRKVKTDTKGQSIQWKNIREVMVKKNGNNTIYLKNSHLSNNDYQCIHLKRTAIQVTSVPSRLNYPSGPKISIDKYNDLIDLCSGTTPVINLPEYVNFYKNLPH